MASWMYYFVQIVLIFSLKKCQLLLMYVPFNFPGERKSCFLDRADSEECVKVFKTIRLQHILNDKPSLSTIEADKIIPESVLV